MSSKKLAGQGHLVMWWLREFSYSDAAESYLKGSALHSFLSQMWPWGSIPKQDLIPSVCTLPRVNEHRVKHLQRLCKRIYCSTPQLSKKDTDEKCMLLEQLLIASFRTGGSGPIWGDKPVSSPTYVTHKCSQWWGYNRSYGSHMQGTKIEQWGTGSVRDLELSLVLCRA